MRYTLAQAGCLGAVLIGVYLLLGVGATLIIGGLVGAAIATYAEHQSASSPEGATGGSGEADRGGRGGAPAASRTTGA